MSGQQNRRIVVVLGMHRSGTSAIARALEALGVDLGNRLMPPVQGVNDKGFHEDEDVVQLNVGLLGELARDWHTLIPIRAADLCGSIADRLRIRAVDLLRDRLRERPVFGLKDPRMALLLPFWKSVFEHIDAQVSFVICSRNPLSVARSLKARDDFDDEKSFFLWLQHVVPCFLETEGNPRVVVDYDLMVDDPEKQLARISNALVLPFDRHEPALSEYTARFLEQGLRHTRFEAKDLDLVPSLPPEVAAAFRLMTRLARDELPVDSEQIPASMLQWAEAIERMKAAWSYMARCEADIADLTEKLSERDQQITALNDGLSCLTTQIPALNQTLSERNGQISTLNQVLAERNEQVFVFNQWLGVRDERIAALNIRLSDLSAEIQTLTQTVSDRDGEISTLTQSLAERNEQICSLHKRLADCDARILALDHSVAEGKERIAGLQVEHDERIARDARIAVLERAFAEVEAQRNKLLASMSWRITKPLRVFRKEFGGAPTKTSGPDICEPASDFAVVSSSVPATDFCYNLDQLIVDEQALMAFGWILNKQKAIATLSLKVTSASTRQALHANYGRTRDDVLASLQEFPQARFSGFMVITAWNGSSIDGLALSGTLEDGTDFDIPVHTTGSKMVAVQAGASSAILRQWLSFGKRGLSLIALGRFDLLLAKTRKFFDSRMHGATAKNAAELRQMIEPALNDDAVLVIDHAMGGGANTYRDGLVAQKRKEGKVVLLLTYQIASLSLALSLLGRNIEKTVRIPTLEMLIELMDSLKLKEILYNDAVSFVQPQQIPEFLLKLKARHPDVVLSMAVHDYYAICPSPFLLNDRGVYCGVPGIDVCRECLRANHQPFMSLYPSRDIGQWRSLWGAALQAADRILAFSHSSVDIMRRAYPGTEQDKYLVSPHAIDRQCFPPITPNHTEALHIGVLGHIGLHKGADIVNRLADEIVRREEPIRITIIGTLEAVYRKEVITETGPYRPEDLPDLIRQSGANVFLFPSVCPETFSFVVGELIQMTLPVVCFNIGAPAERVKNYAKGKVLDFMDPGRLIEELIDFHMSTYLLGEAYE